MFDGDLNPLRFSFYIIFSFSWPFFHCSRLRGLVILLFLAFVFFFFLLFDSSWIISLLLLIKKNKKANHSLSSKIGRTTSARRSVSPFRFCVVLFTCRLMIHRDFTIVETLVIDQSIAALCVLTDVGGKNIQSRKGADDKPLGFFLILRVYRGEKLSDSLQTNQHYADPCKKRW